MSTTDPQAAQDITAESTIGYDDPRRQLERPPEGVVVTIDGHVYTLTPADARAVATLLEESAKNLSLRSQDNDPGFPGVTIRLDMRRPHELTAEQARDLADQLVEAAIEAENAGELDDHDRAAATFRGQFG